MADNPLSAPNDGKIGMPSITASMNKLPPTNESGGKGSKDDKANTRLGMTKEKSQEVLDRARKRMDRAIQAEGDNRKAAQDDDKFYAGQQWPAEIMAQRSFDQRPCLTINKLPTLVKQVTNDVRQNRPDINVSPVGDKSDPEGAKMFAGIIRHIERKSQADIAYDTAFEQTARGGFGFWRIMTEYEKPNSLNQVLSIKRIRNRFTVYMDPACQEPDGADMDWCFVTEMMTREEFKENYPDADPMPWTVAGVGDTYKSNWITKDEIRVAEYYEFENEKRTYVMLSNGSEGWEGELEPSLFDQFEVVAERESDCRKIRWYKLTAVEILEDRDVLGRWIPVVRTVGDEIDLEGKPMWVGIVRNAKDPQRAYNYWSTSFTEAVALAPKAPWLLAEGQDEGYEQQFKNANTRPQAVLRYKPVTIDNQLAPPPQRLSMGEVPQGIQTGLMNAGQDMMATTGIRFDGTIKDKVYDESGRALRELRRFGDLGSFHLVDNLARALRHTGEILVDLIPLIYERKQVVTILRQNGEEERIMLDPNHGQAVGQMKQDNGKDILIFNPKFGEYGVTVTIGPSYATKRIEAAESMMDFLRAVAPAVPQAASAVMDLIARNSDWPGSEDFAVRLSKVVAELHPGILTPNMKDVPPEVQAVISGLMRKLQEQQQQQVVLTKALTERQTEFALQHEKIQKDFEKALLQIAQKADQAQMQAEAHAGSQMQDLVKAVMQMQTMLEKRDSSIQ